MANIGGSLPARQRLLIEVTNSTILHGEVNYYVTQLLSDHGYFNKYLHRMGKTVSPYCLYEVGEIIDDKEHTVSECARWQS